MNEEVEALRLAVERLREELTATDEWANGVQHLLLAVLPFLLRGHPEAGKVRDLLASATARYEELLAHPHRASPGEALGRYEAKKIAYRTLALLGVWPGVDPRQAAGESLRRAGFPLLPDD